MDIAGHQEVRARNIAQKSRSEKRIFAGRLGTALDGHRARGHALSDDPRTHGRSGLGIAAEDDTLDSASMPDIDGKDTPPIRGGAHHSIADRIAAEYDENGALGISPGVRKPLSVPGWRHDGHQCREEPENGE